jgi:hypothetical protein
MLGNLKNMFKGSAKAKPSTKNSAPKAEKTEAPAPAKVEAPAPKAEKPAAKKNEDKGGFNLLGILDNNGNGAKKEAKKPSKPEPKPVSRQSAGPNEFFLSADDAKTFGDIDYMRTAKAIRKSFPKAPGKSEGTEIEVFVSNMAEEKGETAAKPAETATSGFGSSQPSFTPNSKVKTDTNMDMFRNMAKGIGKR